jgi:hypothetical protein
MIKVGRPLNLVLYMPFRIFAYSSNILKAYFDLMDSMSVCGTLKWVRLSCKYVVPRDRGVPTRGMTRSWTRTWLMLEWVWKGRCLYGALEGSIEESKDCCDMVLWWWRPNRGRVTWGSWMVIDQTKRQRVVWVRKFFGGRTGETKTGRTCW